VVQEMASRERCGERAVLLCPVTASKRLNPSRSQLIKRVGEEKGTNLIAHRPKIGKSNWELNVIYEAITVLCIY
jgi:hypothetical protein